MVDIGSVGGPPRPAFAPGGPATEQAGGVDALLRQLGLSLVLADLHVGAAARQPENGDLLASLASDHRAHAAELVSLISSEVDLAQGSGLREVVERARAAAVSACLVAPVERPRHIEVLGMIAASLASNRMVLDSEPIGW